MSLGYQFMQYSMPYMLGERKVVIGGKQKPWNVFLKVSPLESSGGFVKTQESHPCLDFRLACWAISGTGQRLFLSTAVSHNLCPCSYGFVYRFLCITSSLLVLSEFPKFSTVQKSLDKTIDSLDQISGPVQLSLYLMEKNIFIVSFESLSGHLIYKYTLNIIQNRC